MSNTPDITDEALLTRGLSALGPAAGTTRATGKTLVIACGALAREILDIKEANQLDHIDLTCLPAKLHLYPEQIVAYVEAAVQKHSATYDTIHVVYADCGTGGQLEEKCAELGVEMIAGPHCYSFFEGNEKFAEYGEAGEITAFYLTDFLVKQFDAFVWRPMGLDRHPDLLEMLFGNYEKLVYLAQTNDPVLDAKAEEAAARLKLSYERRFTGYGDMARALSDFA